MSEWTIDKSKELYKVEKWSDGHFTINESGNAAATVPGGCTHQIDLSKVINEMKEQGIAFPAVIRFHDILRSRVRTLNETFKQTIEESNYNGDYMGVYPIKVNQMREVVEEIVDVGSRYNYGLEAGSKPELLAVLSMNLGLESLIILNGYKDEDYLRLALLGNKIGKKIIIVIEKFSEVSKILKVSSELKIKPIVGIRAKMSATGKGRWSSSSGEKAKFGLSSSEILKCVNIFKREGLVDSIKLLHFHIGSQIPEINSFKEAVNEGSRIFCQLSKLGVPLKYFDVGGGLGIDYDGTKSLNDSSTNYRMSEYISDVVYGVKQVCNLEDVEHPIIVTESGRAITAHHSCVVTNVIGKIEASDDHETEISLNEHILVSNMREVEVDLYEKNNFQEALNDALQIKDDSLSAFKLGVISLEEKAKIETIYSRINSHIEVKANELEQVPHELQSLVSNNSPKYLCNFSVFQSAADSWAIGQVLPVLPISNHHQRPTVSCSIADITCDSDGKIDHFIEHDGNQNTFPVHELEKDKDYYLGIFLTGAYQDVMGDMHNLFGRLNEVHVFKDKEDDSGFYIEEFIKGQSCAKVLSTMQYNPQFMAYTIKKEVDSRIASGDIQPRMGVKLVNFYEDCLRGYTYLNN
jgi:arginine decarboxylase